MDGSGARMPVRPFTHRAHSSVPPIRTSCSPSLYKLLTKFSCKHSAEMSARADNCWRNCGLSRVGWGRVLLPCITGSIWHVVVAATPDVCVALQYSAVGQESPDKSQMVWASGPRGVWMSMYKIYTVIFATIFLGGRQQGRQINCKPCNKTNQMCV